MSDAETPVSGPGAAAQGPPIPPRGPAGALFEPYHFPPTAASAGGSPLYGQGGTPAASHSTPNTSGSGAASIGAGWSSSSGAGMGGRLERGFLLHHAQSGPAAPPMTRGTSASSAANSSLRNLSGSDERPSGTSSQQGPRRPSSAAVLLNARRLSLNVLDAIHRYRFPLSPGSSSSNEPQRDRDGSPVSRGGRPARQDSAGTVTPADATSGGSGGTSSHHTGAPPPMPQREPRPMDRLESTLCERLRRRRVAQEHTQRAQLRADRECVFFQLQQVHEAMAGLQSSAREETAAIAAAARGHLEALAAEHEAEAAALGAQLDEGIACGVAELLGTTAGSITNAVVEGARATLERLEAITSRRQAALVAAHAPRPLQWHSPPPHTTPAAAPPAELPPSHASIATPAASPVRPPQAFLATSAASLQAYVTSPDRAIAPVHADPSTNTPPRRDPHHHDHHHDDPAGDSAALFVPPLQQLIEASHFATADGLVHASHTISAMVDHARAARAAAAQAHALNRLYAEGYFAVLSDEAADRWLLVGEMVAGLTLRGIAHYLETAPLPAPAGSPHESSSDDEAVIAMLFDAVRETRATEGERLRQALQETDRLRSRLADVEAEAARSQEAAATARATIDFIAAQHEGQLLLCDASLSSREDVGTALIAAHAVLAGPSPIPIVRSDGTSTSSGNAAGSKQLQSSSSGALATPGANSAASSATSLAARTVTTCDNTSSSSTPHPTTNGGQKKSTPLQPTTQSGGENGKSSGGPSSPERERDRSHGAVQGQGHVPATQQPSAGGSSGSLLSGTMNQTSFFSVGGNTTASNVSPLPIPPSPAALPQTVGSPTRAIAALNVTAVKGPHIASSSGDSVYSLRRPIPGVTSATSSATSHSQNNSMSHHALPQPAVPLEGTGTLEGPRQHTNTHLAPSADSPRPHKPFTIHKPSLSLSSSMPLPPPASQLLPDRDRGSPPIPSTPLGASHSNPSFVASSNNNSKTSLTYFSRGTPSNPSANASSTSYQWSNAFSAAVAAVTPGTSSSQSAGQGTPQDIPSHAPGPAEDSAKLAATSSSSGASRPCGRVTTVTINEPEIIDSTRRGGTHSTGSQSAPAQSLASSLRGQSPNYSAHIASCDASALPPEDVNFSVATSVEVAALRPEHAHRLGTSVDVINSIELGHIPTPYESHFSLSRLPNRAASSPVLRSHDAHGPAASGAVSRTRSENEGTTAVLEYPDAGPLLESEENSPVTSHHAHMAEMRADPPTPSTSASAEGTASSVAAALPMAHVGVCSSPTYFAGGTAPNGDYPGGHAETRLSPAADAPPASRTPAESDPSEPRPEDITSPVSRGDHLLESLLGASGPVGGLPFNRPRQSSAALSNLSFAGDMSAALGSITTDRRLSTGSNVPPLLYGGGSITNESVLAAFPTLFERNVETATPQGTLDPAHITPSTSITAVPSSHPSRPVNTSSHSISISNTSAPIDLISTQKYVSFSAGQSTNTSPGAGGSGSGSGTGSGANSGGSGNGSTSTPMARQLPIAERSPIDRPPVRSSSSLLAAAAGTSTAPPSSPSPAESASPNLERQKTGEYPMPRPRPHCERDDDTPSASANTSKTALHASLDDNDAAETSLQSTRVYRRRSSSSRASSRRSSQASSQQQSTPKSAPARRTPRARSVPEGAGAQVPPAPPQRASSDDAPNQDPSRVSTGDPIVVHVESGVLLPPHPIPPNGGSMDSAASQRTGSDLRPCSPHWGELRSRASSDGPLALLAHVTMLASVGTTHNSSNSLDDDRSVLTPASGGEQTPLSPTYCPAESTYPSGLGGDSTATGGGLNVVLLAESSMQDRTNPTLTSFRRPPSSSVAPSSHSGSPKRHHSPVHGQMLPSAQRGFGGSMRRTSVLSAHSPASVHVVPRLSVTVGESPPRDPIDAPTAISATGRTSSAATDDNDMSQSIYIVVADREYDAMAAAESAKQHSSSSQAPPGAEPPETLPLIPAAVLPFRSLSQLHMDRGSEEGGRGASTPRGKGLSSGTNVHHLQPIHILPFRTLSRMAMGAQSGSSSPHTGPADGVGASSSSRATFGPSPPRPSDGPLQPAAGLLFRTLSNMTSLAGLDVSGASPVFLSRTSSICNPYMLAVPDDWRQNGFGRAESSLELSAWLHGGSTIDSRTPSRRDPSHPPDGDGALSPSNSAIEPVLRHVASNAGWVTMSYRQQRRRSSGRPAATSPTDWGTAREGGYVSFRLDLSPTSTPSPTPLSSMMASRTNTSDRRGPLGTTASSSSATSRTQSSARFPPPLARASHLQPVGPHDVSSPPSRISSFVSPRQAGRGASDVQALSPRQLSPGQHLPWFARSDSVLSGRDAGLPPRPSSGSRLTNNYYRTCLASPRDLAPVGSFHLDIQHPPPLNRHEHLSADLAATMSVCPSDFDLSQAADQPFLVTAAEAAQRLHSQSSQSTASSRAGADPISDAPLIFVSSHDIPAEAEAGDFSTAPPPPGTEAAPTATGDDEAGEERPASISAEGKPHGASSRASASGTITTPSADNPLSGASASQSPRPASVVQNIPHRASNVSSAPAYTETAAGSPLRSKRNSEESGLNSSHTSVVQAPPPPVVAEISSGPPPPRAQHSNSQSTPPVATEDANASHSHHLLTVNGYAGSSGLFEPGSHRSSRDEGGSIRGLLPGAEAHDLSLHSTSTSRGFFTSRMSFPNRLSNSSTTTMSGMGGTVGSGLGFISPAYGSFVNIVGSRSPFSSVTSPCPGLPPRFALTSGSTISGARNSSTTLPSPSIGAVPGSSSAHPTSLGGGQHPSLASSLNSFRITSSATPAGGGRPRANSGHSPHFFNVVGGSALLVGTPAALASQSLQSFSLSPNRHTQMMASQTHTGMSLSLVVDEAMTAPVVVPPHKAALAAATRPLLASQPRGPMAFRGPPAASDDSSPLGHKTAATRPRAASARANLALPRRREVVAAASLHDQLLRVPRSDQPRSASSSPPADEMLTNTVTSVQILDPFWYNGSFAQHGHAAPEDDAEEDGGQEGASEAPVDVGPAPNATGPHAGDTSKESLAVDSRTEASRDRHECTTAMSRETVAPTPALSAEPAHEAPTPSSSPVIPMRKPLPAPQQQPPQQHPPLTAAMLAANAAAAKAKEFSAHRLTSSWAADQQRHGTDDQQPAPMHPDTEDEAPKPLTPPSPQPTVPAALMSPLLDADRTTTDSTNTGGPLWLVSATSVSPSRTAARTVSNSFASSAPFSIQQRPISGGQGRGSPRGLAFSVPRGSQHAPPPLAHATQTSIEDSTTPSDGVAAVSHPTDPTGNSSLSIRGGRGAGNSNGSEKTPLTTFAELGVSPFTDPPAAAGPLPGRGGAVFQPIRDPAVSQPASTPRAVSAGSDQHGHHGGTDAYSPPASPCPSSQCGSTRRKRRSIISLQAFAGDPDRPPFFASLEGQQLDKIIGDELVAEEADGAMDVSGKGPAVAGSAAAPVAEGAEPSVAATVATSSVLADAPTVASEPASLLTTTTTTTSAQRTAGSNPGSHVALREVSSAVLMCPSGSGSSFSAGSFVPDKGTPPPSMRAIAAAMGNGPPSGSLLSGSSATETTSHGVDRSAVIASLSPAPASPASRSPLPKSLGNSTTTFHVVPPRAAGVGGGGEGEGVRPAPRPRLRSDAEVIAVDERRRPHGTSALPAGLHRAVSPADVAPAVAMPPRLHGWLPHPLAVPPPPVAVLTGSMSVSAITNSVTSFPFINVLTTPNDDSAAPPADPYPLANSSVLFPTVSTASSPDHGASQPPVSSNRMSVVSVSTATRSPSRRRSSGLPSPVLQNPAPLRVHGGNVATAFYGSLSVASGSPLSSLTSSQMRHPIASAYGSSRSVRTLSLMGDAQSSGAPHGPVDASAPHTPIPALVVSPDDANVAAPAHADSDPLVLNVSTHQDIVKAGSSLHPLMLGATLGPDGAPALAPATFTSCKPPTDGPLRGGAASHLTSDRDPPTPPAVLGGAATERDLLNSSGSAPNHSARNYGRHATVSSGSQSRLTTASGSVVELAPTPVTNTSSGLVAPSSPSQTAALPSRCASLAAPSETSRTTSIMRSVSASTAATHAMSAALCNSFAGIITPLNNPQRSADDVHISHYNSCDSGTSTGASSGAVPPPAMTPLTPLGQGTERVELTAPTTPTPDADGPQALPSTEDAPLEAQGSAEGTDAVTTPPDTAQLTLSPPYAAASLHSNASGTAAFHPNSNGNSGGLGQGMPRFSPRSGAGVTFAFGSQSPGRGSLTRGSFPNASLQQTVSTLSASTSSAPSPYFAAAHRASLLSAMTETPLPASITPPTGSASSHAALLEVTSSSHDRAQHMPNSSRSLSLVGSSATSGTSARQAVHCTPPSHASSTARSPRPSLSTATADADAVSVVEAQPHSTVAVAAPTALFTLPSAATAAAIAAAALHPPLSPVPSLQRGRNPSIEQLMPAVLSTAPGLVAPSLSVSGAASRVISGSGSPVTRASAPRPASDAYLDVDVSLSSLNLARYVSSPRALDVSSSTAASRLASTANLLQTAGAGAGSGGSMHRLYSFPRLSHSASPVPQSGAGSLNLPMSSGSSLLMTSGGPPLLFSGDTTASNSTSSASASSPLAHQHQHHPLQLYTTTSSSTSHGHRAGAASRCPMLAIAAGDEGIQRQQHIISEGIARSLLRRALMDATSAITAASGKGSSHQGPQPRR